MTTFRIALLALALSTAAACDTYDPPPEVKLVQPAIGFWVDDTPIELTFTEPIDPATLSITVWPSEKDIEGNLIWDVTPLVADCTTATSPCGTMTLTLDESRTRATLTQNGAFAGRIGKPLVLEVAAGLKDVVGRARKVPTSFDFQINPKCGNLPLDIDFETGVMTLTANLQVLPIWLHMYLDFAIDKATGRVQVFGTYARLKKDGAEQLPPNYNHPDGFEAELGETGWAVTFTGCFVEQSPGVYFLQSDPFDVGITVLNVIPVTLTAFQVQGTLTLGGGEDGRDKIAGTLSTSGGTFGDPPTNVDPITTAWDGFSVRVSEVDPGLPQVCEEAPCAAMTAGGGDCQLPAGWNPATYCE
jgi:hypothetical protein